MKEEMQEDIEKLKLLTWKEVTAGTRLSRMTSTREIQKGNFPNPVNISERKVRFKFEEIEQWRNSLN